jgi:uncharacterized protein YjdB
MKKLLKRIAVLLVIALIAPVVLPSIPLLKGLSSTDVYAATQKASLENKKATVGISSTPEYIYINNSNEDASYTFKSNDKKIATVNKYGDIKGVKKGSTTITVSEKYKGKTKTVGKVAVKVVGAKLITKELQVGANSYAQWIVIDYLNSKATYKFKSSDNKIATVDESGFVMGLKTGSADISISETYKGKTAKLGTVKVTVAGASISEDSKDVNLGVNSETALTGLISIENQNYEAEYTAESADTSIVTCESVTDPDTSEKSFVLKGAAVGTTTLTVYENYQGDKKALGTVNVTVKEIQVEDFTFYSDDLDTENGVPTITYYLDDLSPDWSSLQYLFEISPYNATTPVTCVSDKETVVKVDNDGNVTPVGEGTAKISVSCGKFTYDIQVIVKKSEDTDSEDYEYEEY